MDVSIVIVNWNTRQLLADCINSIYANAGEADYEIIVVDNASSDGSADMVRECFGGIRLITNSENLGLAAANNQAIAAAGGRYILLLNSDTIVCKGTVDGMVRYADLYPAGAVFGCQVRENQTTIQPTCFRFPSILNIVLRITGLARLFKQNRFFGREMMLWWKRDTARRVDVVSGMFMFVRREAIEEVGLMDEDFFLYFEETDWCYRFSKAGWEMIFWPGVKIVHLDGGNKSTDQQAVKMKIQYRKSMLFFFRKHYGLVSSVVARVLVAADSAVRFIVWTALALFKKFFGKNVTSELVARRNYWNTLRYCVFGSEPI